LVNQDYPRHRFEVILVDDGSAKPIHDVVARFCDHIRITLLVQKNTGPARARQNGVAVARGRFLAFTDDDCRPAPDWLARAEQACHANPQCALVGTVINGLAANAYSEASQLMVSYVYSYLNTTREHALYACTDNVVFPACQFRAMGGLDTRWAISGGEDRDLCHRWCQTGFRMIWPERLVVYHYHALSLRSFWRQHFSYGRGGFAFRSRCAGGKLSRLRFENWRFYARLPLFPFTVFPWRRALPLAGLLVFSQAANTAGFLWQCMVATMLRVPSRKAHISTFHPYSSQR
jgi:glycosyltransferase involved in cell wall biosynthesis